MTINSNDLLRPPESAGPASGIHGEKPGQTLAVWAEALYLINLLLLPGIAFAVLAYFWYRTRNVSGIPLLARSHLRQTFFVSLVGGALIVSLSVLFIVTGGLHWEWTWVVVILYFTCVHSLLILCGMFGLARALSGQMFRYPLLGRWLE